MVANGSAALNCRAKLYDRNSFLHGSRYTDHGPRLPPPRTNPRPRRLGLRRHRRRHHDRHRHLPQARRNGPRRPHRQRRLRRVDRRRNPLPLWRVVFRRTGRRHPRSRRRVRLPSTRLRSSLGLSFRLDAFHRGPPQFPLVHRRRPDAFPKFSDSSRRRPNLYIAHRHSRPHDMDQALRFRLHLGATASRSLDRRHDRHKLSRRPPRRRRPGFSDRHQNYVRSDCDWCRVFFARRSAQHSRSDVARRAERQRPKRISSRTSRRSLGLRRLGRFKSSRERSRKTRSEIFPAHWSAESHSSP